MHECGKLKAMKEQDVKYKMARVVTLQKAMDELRTDLASATEEVRASTLYLDKLKEQCVAKADSYEQEKARRASEVAGLKQALEVLSSEGQAAAGSASLLQFEFSSSAGASGASSGNRHVKGLRGHRA
eukprot:NODE_7746_length_423_cov_240.625000.p2 GENE.NODE_7746_length_423_cov_240.625000~~NODE_7746_length_423_cov_240.625000.p2  ORF type:complete len:128 (-),score=45.97 NODE_7746_length_423_cov_240.625000:6-389(-)